MTFTSYLGAATACARLGLPLAAIGSTGSGYTVPGAS